VEPERGKAGQDTLDVQDGDGIGVDMDVVTAQAAPGAGVMAGGDC